MQYSGEELIAVISLFSLKHHMVLSGFLNRFEPGIHQMRATQPAPETSAARRQTPENHPPEYRGANRSSGWSLPAKFAFEAEFTHSGQRRIGQYQRRGICATGGFFQYAKNALHTIITDMATAASEWRSGQQSVF
ncbi:hypothetical protein [Lelliottia sp. JS-SCA-14]|uniref:hypothetical protein n=1 Tax=Lelliottia sp. JS-SCA-14 TaxID=3110110 RepID=UPI002D774621|nr:hypothetical protein [Lelliottia sp. JS-SCA-14]